MQVQQLSFPHLDNFPVHLWLVPGRYRQDVRLFYRFVREAHRLVYDEAMDSALRLEHIERLIEHFVHFPRGDHVPDSAALAH